MELIPTATPHNNLPKIKHGIFANNVIIVDIMQNESKRKQVILQPNFSMRMEEKKFANIAPKGIKDVISP